MGVEEVLEGIGKQPSIETTIQNTHMKYLISAWDKEIVEYLLTLRCPLSCDKTKYQTLRLKSQNFIIENGLFYWRDPSGILLLSLIEPEVEEVMAKFHEGIFGGHYSWRATIHKILKASFF